MDINTIKEKIKSNTIIKNIIFLDEVDSTNQYAKENDIESGTVIVTENQTNGKGKGEAKWYSSIGKNVTMSIVVLPNVTIDKLEGLTIKVGEQIKKAIKEKYNISLIVKYPNDLICNNRKICGILIETILIGINVKKIVIGIGFNINETEMNDEIGEIATSLKLETNKEYNLEEIICLICNAIEEAIDF